MSKFFINRPIVAMVISILMTLIGLVAMSGLPIAQFPKIVPPEIKVNSNYTGADALTVEQAVAPPIEQQTSGVDNMNYMYSLNANNGQSTVTVNFDIAAACSSSRYRSHGAEVDFLAADYVCVVFAEGDVRQCLSSQLRLHQP